ncbi:hypothetical protein CK203_101405 [Vitis vinifera]|uniref:Uncharacterized protein n=1 Tax=Vitis vinifera TaxID=29760 RepID=A0A438F2C0_VITVI|nr:hypothetical protein CK203_101405 [Vitis vinifera]
MQTFGLSACFVEDRKILHATLIANETETKSWEKKRNYSNWGVEEVDRAAAVFGCKVGNLPTNYLGLPLGASHKSCRVGMG